MTTYLDFKKTQKVISNQDFEPKIIDNIFLPEHIEHIYEIINSTPESATRIQPFAGHKVWDVDLGWQIIDRINSAIKESLGDSLALKGDYSFARYSTKTGYRPKLFPHYDTRNSQRVTFDIQVRTNEDWGIVVEDKQFNLKDNQALVFAGTQQVHWRENKVISDGTEIDMIFCHLEYLDDRALDDNQEITLRERVEFLMNQTMISNEPEVI